jgi:hypothetical protein
VKLDAARNDLETVEQERDEIRVRICLGYILGTSSISGG